MIGTGLEQFGQAWLFRDNKSKTIALYPDSWVRGCARAVFQDTDKEIGTAEIWEVGKFEAGMIMMLKKHHQKAHLHLPHYFVLGDFLI